MRIVGYLGLRGFVKVIVGFFVFIVWYRCFFFYRFLGGRISVINYL